MGPALLENALNRRSFWSGVLAVMAFVLGPESLAEADVADCTRRVKQVLVEHLGVDEKQVTLRAEIINDLGADSLDFVELVMAVEEEFGLKIPDDDCEKLVTVGDLVAFLRKHGQCS